MRIYLPATAKHLRELVSDGVLAVAGEEAPAAFAVTPGLRSVVDADLHSDDEGDIEEWEYAAMLAAGRESLRLLAADAGVARRRVVVAADVADSAVEVRDDLSPGAVQVAGSVPLAAVASVHVDDADAVASVAAAAEAVVAADGGDADALERVDDADDFELSWYANQEIASLLDEL